MEKESKVKGKLGDIAIVVSIIAVIGVLVFLKRDAIMDALHIERVPEDGEEEMYDEAEEDDGDLTDVEVVPADDAPAVSEPLDTGLDESDEAPSEEAAPQVRDPLLAATNVPVNNSPANVPDSGLVENNIIGMSWENLKKNYSYSDFDADKDDLADLRFQEEEGLKYYQSPGSGELFGIRDDQVEVYVKKWEHVPLNEALSVDGLFDIVPYIYQATDKMNFYEWRIANCYVGLFVEDTGEGVKDTAPLRYEIYVLKKEVNTFFK